MNKVKSSKFYAGRIFLFFEYRLKWFKSHQEHRQTFTARCKSMHIQLNDIAYHGAVMMLTRRLNPSNE